MPQYTVTLTSPDAAKARLRAALRLLGFDVVRIDEVQAGAPKPRPKRDNRPQSPEALAVAALFRRRPETAWSEEEIKAFTAARKANLLTTDDMTIIAKYYEAERKKGSEGHHRRDLLTFVRHAGGELDRATQAVTHKPRMKEQPYRYEPPKVVPMPEPTPEEKAAHEHFMAQLAERKARQA